MRLEEENFLGMKTNVLSRDDEKKTAVAIAE